MNLDYYKNELTHLDKAHFNEVQEWLGRAETDSDISMFELSELNDIADKIYYGQPIN